MNRRNFFTKLGLASASIAILPSATTYARKWVKSQSIWITQTELSKGITADNYFIFWENWQKILNQIEWKITSNQFEIQSISQQVEHYLINKHL